MRYLLAVVAAIVVAAGLFGPRSVVPIQGDELGPREGETRQDYAARAGEELQRAVVESAAKNAASASGARFAAVSFRYPVSAAQAAEDVAAAPRVSAVIVGANAPISVPEPVAEGDPQGRAAVFTAAAASEPLSGVVVWASPQTLAEIAASPHVLAVEPAPADAAWGSFGIRVR